MADNKKQVQKQFGRAADDYATSDVHARGESLRLLVEVVKPQAGWHMLDVATGAGHTAIAFAPFVSSVMASDLTDEMLLKAEELAGRAGIGNLQTRKADAENLTFADSSFDLVTCRLAFHHFPQPRSALAGFARVLKPSGILGFTDNVTVEDRFAADYYNDFERLRDPSHQRVYSMSQLQTMLVEAGFQIRDSAILTKEFEFHAWADRQRVSADDKQRLLKMMDQIPGELQPLFQPRRDQTTMYFSLWEAVIVASRS
jgi:ubiquinone/menaquinone biosynthesis C-methylase UbiE